MNKARCNKLSEVATNMIYLQFNINCKICNSFNNKI